MNLVCFLYMLSIMQSHIICVHARLKISFGLRDSNFDDIHETENEVFVVQTKSLLNCFASCVNNSLCKSISHNIKNGVCQHFSDVFSKRNVSGEYQHGWQHYDG